MQRPPPGSPGYGARASCSGGSEESAILCNVSLVGFWGFLALGMEVAIFVIIIYAIL